VTDLVPFLGLCLLITITPGLDTAVVVRSALRGGRAAGLRTALGCATGLFVHAVAVAVGLAQLLLHSVIAFEIVKITGALVLVVLGGRSLWSVWRTRGGQAPSTVSAEDADKPRRATPLIQGLLTNLTNPKATLFFIATMPQFVPVDHPAQAVPVALGLGAIAVLFSLGGLSLTALGVHRVRHLLQAPRVRRVQDALVGTTLVALGIRVATE
jgi:threonine/homoserine/homoserine lactone efflux protein